MNIDIDGFNLDDMDKRFSWKKQGPIRTPAQMIKPIEWNKDAIDVEWSERLKDRWWASNYNKVGDLDFPHLKMREFGQKLCSFGGKELCCPGVDEDLLKLESRGQLWYPDGTKMMRGAQSQCHENSANLWDSNRHMDNLAIATGYALSDDGMWRQHSWCVLSKARTVNVVETTEKRAAYFGFVLTPEEAEEFYFNNAF